MKLLIKFNLLLIVVFGLGLAAISFAGQSFLQREAETEVVREAGLMSASALATRDYTEKNVSPLLEKTLEHSADFLPQTIPFFAASKTFEQVQKSYPDYTYKEAAINPTNLDDRTTDWEADIVDRFRKAPLETELVGKRETPAGTSIYLAHPIRVSKGCLQCHSDPAAAPRAMLKHYGSRNGFGWKLGEVIGAQIITVPLSVAEEKANQGLTELLMDLSGIFLVAIALIDLGLYLIVIKPLRAISSSADRISRGEMDLTQLQAKGNDEVAQVTRSFNRMHTSLQKAMELLND